MPSRTCPLCHGSGEIGVKDPRTGSIAREEYGQQVTRPCPRCGEDAA